MVVCLALYLKEVAIFFIFTVVFNDNIIIKLREFQLPKALLQNVFYCNKSQDNDIPNIV